MHEQAATILDHLLMLLDKYYRELRSSTQPARLSARQSLAPGYRYEPGDELIRQNLMGHVGEVIRRLSARMARPAPKRH